MNTSAMQVALLDHSYKITRDLDAPVDMVYRAWVDPEQFKRWWGPHSFQNDITAYDAQPGGKLRVVMSGPDGGEYPMNGEFKELVPGQKIVMVLDLVEHPVEWHRFYNQTRGLPEDTPIPLAKTTITLEDLGNKRTRMHVEQWFELASDRDAFIELGTTDGWRQSFVKLDNLLATLQTEREMIVSRVVDAPKELVWKAWSSAEHVAKWWGPNGFRNTFTEFDLRTGGRWVYTMHGPDGTDYPNWMEFEEVVPMERILYIHGSFENDPDSFRGHTTFEEVEGNKTRVTLHLTVQSGAVRDHFMGFGAFEGGDQNLSRLVAYLQEV